VASSILLSLSLSGKKPVCSPGKPIPVGQPSCILWKILLKLSLPILKAILDTPILLDFINISSKVKIP
jgi:hypothetical protein